MPVRKRRMRSGYLHPEPIGPDFCSPDVSVPQAMAFLGLSGASILRLIAKDEVESYRLGGARRIVFESLKQYRLRELAKGPRLSERPKTGKRPPGRPKAEAAS
jgi:hypothetical protein